MEAYPDSYYAASANPAPDRPAVEGEVEADVCVVGGGYSGLSTAITLLEKGHKVTFWRPTASAGARRAAMAGRSSTG